MTLIKDLSSTFKKDPILDNHIKAFFFHRRIELKYFVNKR